MNLGKPLATGRTAEIFSWSEGQILKLYHREWPLTAAEHEARVTLAMREAGLPVPRVGDLVQIAGRAGLTFDRYHGGDLASSLSRQPWTVFRGAQLLAQLHAQMGDVEASALPSQREWISRRIERATTLPPAVRHAALDSLSAKPTGDQVCHGDFHPGNVLITGHAAVVIDWPLATSGNPVADVAQTSLLLMVAAPLSGPFARVLRAPPLEAGRKWFRNLYLRAYRGYRSVSPSLLSEWTPLLAAARLSDGVPGEREALLGIVLPAFRSAA